jgi:S-adenosylmethionine hydrolase
MPVVLMTDFGLQDIYAGVMKGVIGRLAPQATTIDLTHSIAPQNIRQAAFKLRNAYQYFPAGSIFLVVVDPGVGSTRRPVAVSAGEYLFVAPDNGVLSYVLEAIGGKSQAVEIRVDELRLSSTFHGRDVFAPAAAKLAVGAGFEMLGNSVSDLVMLPSPRLEIEQQRIIGEILDIDQFGNLITSIGEFNHNDDELELMPVFGTSRQRQRFDKERARICIRDTVVDAVQHTYADVEPSELLVLVGSSNFLEISINQGSAAQHLHASIGDAVEIMVGG